MYKLGAMRATAFLIGSLVGAGSSVAAPVIYDNIGNVAVQNALQSDQDPTSRFTADDFRLQAGANTITDVHWTGIYASDNSPGTDSFTLQFFNDAGGKPSATPSQTYVVGGLVNRADTGTNLFGNLDLYSYSADIAPLVLPANTTFWISIFNDTTTDLNDNWLWGFGSFNTANSAVRVGTVNAWQTQPGNAEMDFQLTGSAVTTGVPEPASLALLGIGLAGLGFSRRQRSQKFSRIVGVDSHPELTQ